MVGSSRITARAIVKALGGAWHGQYGTCPCPAHDDRHPSLSVRESAGRQMSVKCFAGCEHRDVISALRSKGLWPARDDDGFTYKRSLSLQARATPELDEFELSKREAARQIWKHAEAITGTPAGLYLWSRGLDLRRPPPTLRCAPQLYNTETKKPYPALVGAIQDSCGRVTAVQRIWVTDKLVTTGGVAPRKGTKAPLKTAKKTLGPMGDGAIRLGPARRTLGVAEGIETGLSAMQLYRLPVWASCGAWRMGNIAMPDEVERIIIFGDSGAEGIRAAEKAGAAFIEIGREVEIQYPPAGFDDFNDVLMATGRGATT